MTDAKNIAAELRRCANWLRSGDMATLRDDEIAVLYAAATEIERLERELAEARKFLEPLCECDPAVRERLGEPQFQSGGGGSLSR